MRKHSALSRCAPGAHNYTAYEETASSTWLGLRTTRTMLYCQKCGHYLYAERAPADYISSGPPTGGWQTAVGGSVSGIAASAITTGTPLSGTESYTITYGEEGARCQ
jgi:hypothetical protein